MGNKASRQRRSSSTVVEQNFTKPTGLYQTCTWDLKTVKKLILKRKLAPMYPGIDQDSPELDTCPICFLNYPALNVSTCCRKDICTECFLQLRKPHMTEPVKCPYCNQLDYSVKFYGSKTEDQRRTIAEEAVEVEIAQARAREEELRQQAVREEEIRREREAEARQRAEREEAERVERERVRQERIAAGLPPDTPPPSPPQPQPMQQSNSQAERQQRRQQRQAARQQRQQAPRNQTVDSEMRYVLRGLAAQGVDPSGMSVEELEELMLREALSASLNDSAEAVETNPVVADASMDAQQPIEPSRDQRQPQNSQTDGSGQEEDEEDEMLQMAIRLSLMEAEQQQPRQEQAQSILEPESESTTVEEDSHHTGILSPVRQDGIDGGANVAAGDVAVESKADDQQHSDISWTAAFDEDGEGPSAAEAQHQLTSFSIGEQDVTKTEDVHLQAQSGSTQNTGDFDPFNLNSESQTSTSLPGEHLAAESASENSETNSPPSEELNSAEENVTTANADNTEQQPAVCENLIDLDFGE